MEEKKKIGFIIKEKGKKIVVDTFDRFEKHM